MSRERLGELGAPLPFETSSLAAAEPSLLRRRSGLGGLVQRRLFVHVRRVSASREHIRGKLGVARGGSGVRARRKSSMGDLVTVSRVVGQRVGQVLRAALDEELLQQRRVAPVCLPDRESDVSDKRNEADVSYKTRAR